MQILRHSHRSRRGFTLVELLVAISIFLIVSVMTIGAITLSATGQRVREAARLVQSKIEGARDRAIQNARQNPTDPRPVGIRLLVDEADPQLCTGIVYIESPGVDESARDATTNNLIKFVQAGFQGTQPILRGMGTDWGTLADRGLIGPGTIVKVGRSGGNGTVELAIHPGSFPMADPTLLFTLQAHPDATTAGSNPLPYTMQLAPDVMAGEDPLELPPGTCINLKATAPTGPIASTGKLPDGWATSIGGGNFRFSNRMDILFSSNGSVVGSAASAGIINLYLCLREDAIEGAMPGSRTTANDFDGDGQNDPRHGEELGITIFTNAGRTISHPITQLPQDPWTFGLQGEVAR